MQGQQCSLRDRVYVSNLTRKASFSLQPVQSYWDEMQKSRIVISLVLLATTLSLSSVRISTNDALGPSCEVTTTLVLLPFVVSSKLRNCWQLWGVVLFFTFSHTILKLLSFTHKMHTGEELFVDTSELMQVREVTQVVSTVLRISAAPLGFAVTGTKLGFALKPFLLGSGVLQVVVLRALFAIVSSFHIHEPVPKSLLICVMALALMPTALVIWVLYDNEKHMINSRALLQKEALTKQQELLQQKRASENQQAIVRYIFHEVRNPINNITLASELALDKLSPLHQRLRGGIQHDGEVPPSSSSSPSTSTSTSTSTTTVSSTSRSSLKSVCLCNCTQSPPVLTATDTKEVFELVEDIHQSTKAAVRVLNDALNLQKLQSGAFEFVHKPFLLVDLVTFTLRMVAPQMRHKRIAVTTNLDSYIHSVGVVGDFHRLQQVLLNFLTNAYKFTPRGGAVRVCMSVVHRDDEHEMQPQGGVLRVRTSVQNTGQGISDEDKPKIFQPWSQIRAGEQQQGQGSGLGLALCKAFVEQGHKGKVGFDSKLGETTEFFFEIPFAITDPSALQTAQTTLKSHNTSSDIMFSATDEGSAPTRRRIKSLREKPPPPLKLSRARSDVRLGTQGPSVSDSCSKPHGVQVLIVEDSMMCRKLVGKTLLSLGVSFDQCVDGQEAVEKVTVFGVEYFQLILMDKEMPRMDGFEATQELRKLGFCGTIVGCTGNAMDDQVADFVRAGANHVLGKPVTHEALKSTLHHFGVLGGSPKQEHERNPTN